MKMRTKSLHATAFETPSGTSVMLAAIDPAALQKAIKELMPLGVKVDPALVYHVAVLQQEKYQELLGAQAQPVAIPNDWQQIVADYQNDQIMAGEAVNQLAAFIGKLSASPAEPAKQASAEAPTSPLRVGEIYAIADKHSGRSEDTGAFVFKPFSVIAFAEEIQYALLSRHTAVSAPAETPSVRDAVLEEAAKVAEDTDVETTVYCGQTIDDGNATRTSIAAAIRALQGKPEAASTGIKLLDDQIAAWRKEVARLNDLIAHATSETPKEQDR